MRVVSGRRSLGRGDRAREAPRQDEPVLSWDEDEATTVAPMDFDVVSADDLAAARAAPDVDADTVLDDRSVDEILNFALGTDERPFGGREAVRPPSVPAAPVLPPPMPPYGSPPVFTGQPPLTVRSMTEPPPMTTPMPYPGTIPPPVAYAEPYPVQYVHSGPFPYPDLSQPYALQAPPVTARSVAVRWLIPSLALIVVAGGALAVGKFLFADDKGAPATATRPVAPAAAVAPAPASAAPPLAAQAATPAAVAAPLPAAPAASAPAVEPIAAEVAALEHPDGAALASPARGTVSRAYLEGTRRVRAGERLFEIATRSSGGKERELAAKVKQLERLAAQDPVYEEFLERARRERDRSRPRTEEVQVKAAADGVYRAMVATGDRVTADQPLASRTDAGVWTARVTLRSAERPGTSWSCSITPAAGDQGGSKRSRCTIDQIVEQADGVEVSVRIAAADAPWLGDGAGGHRLLFEPPAAGTAGP